MPLRQKGAPPPMEEVGRSGESDERRQEFGPGTWELAVNHRVVKVTGRRCRVIYGFIWRVGCEAVVLWARRRSLHLDSIQKKACIGSVLRRKAKRQSFLPAGSEVPPRTTDSRSGASKHAGRFCQCSVWMTCRPFCKYGVQLWSVQDAEFTSWP